MSEHDKASREHDVEALLAQLPRWIAADLRTSPACLGFLRDGIPLTVDAYMRLCHPGKTPRELDFKEWSAVTPRRSGES